MQVASVASIQQTTSAGGLGSPTAPRKPGVSVCPAEHRTPRAMSALPYARAPCLPFLGCAEQGTPLGFKSEHGEETCKSPTSAHQTGAPRPPLFISGLLFCSSKRRKCASRETHTRKRSRAGQAIPRRPLPAALTS